MSFLPVKIVDLPLWPTDPVPGLVVIQGGRWRTASWSQYLAVAPANVRRRLPAIHRAIEAASLLGVVASEFANRHGFAFADGVTLSFTWRAWGDLQATLTQTPGGYVAFYC